ncbi:MAG: hypothetical protein FWB84_03840 [Candidatus Bathyarchaeota archaeon]|uniref:hypothetical protein n=1 Tax=Candidatus Bathycorpusculum sp. TaxID=2994959 RepID=UPI00282970E8|nr:hypothetical protein [Candidatus Termiticorpusculum sp.]MCL2257731.1 hypothetical protein [Candidatus Termiticorpusculum sp.]MCL2292148.1 hypothetical protein [Candidatus Termiticorpusculum sp.]
MTDVSWVPFGFMVFFAIGVIIFAYLAKKIKNKLYYMYSSLCVSLIFTLLTIVLDQKLLSLVFMGASAVFVAVILFKFVQSPPPNPIIENLDKLDTSGPLRLKDVFTLNFTFKLERKYGEYKAMVIYATVYAGMFSICFLFPLCLICNLPLLRVLTK